MPALSRRLFMSSIAGAGALAIPFPSWLQRRAAGQGAKVRFDASTPQGNAMLRKYVQAVQIMNDPAQTPVTDPRSWIFQWYIHDVRSDTTKAQEIARLYPAPGDQQTWA